MSSGPQYSVLGYRQTEKPAAGRQGERERVPVPPQGDARDRADLPRQPFVTGHDWGDVRARGGTIVDAYAEPPADASRRARLLLRAAEVIADWALAGLEDGTIDRFSIGARGEGEITCTIHGSPVWTECWCWPLMEPTA
jgi:hypothetical protein